MLGCTARQKRAESQKKSVMEARKKVDEFFSTNRSYTDRKSLKRELYQFCKHQGIYTKLGKKFGIKQELETYFKDNLGMKIHVPVINLSSEWDGGEFLLKTSFLGSNINSNTDKDKTAYHKHTNDRRKEPITNLSDETREYVVLDPDFCKFQPEIARALKAWCSDGRSAPFATFMIQKTVIGRDFDKEEYNYYGTGWGGTSYAWCCEDIFIDPSETPVVVLGQCFAPFDDERPPQNAQNIDPNYQQHKKKRVATLNEKHLSEQLRIAEERLQSTADEKQRLKEQFEKIRYDELDTQQLQALSDQLRHCNLEAQRQNTRVKEINAELSTMQSDQRQQQNDKKDDIKKLLSEIASAID